MGLGKSSVSLGGNPTRAELFVQGTRWIERNRPTKRRTTDQADTSSARSQAKTSARRSAILEKFKNDETLISVCGGAAPEGMESLSRSEDQECFARIVMEMLKNFRREKSEFDIIIAVVRHDVDYRNHIALAEHCGLEVCEVRRARERIRYYVKKRYPNGWDSIG